MKTLYEGILSGMEDTLTVGDNKVAEYVVRDIIQKDYKLYKTYKSDITVVGKTESGKILINGKGRIEFTNKTAKSVVNDIFEWNEINGEFICFKCNIESLEGFPRKVISKDLGKGGININQCKKLKTLKGAPSIVFGHFYCIGCDSLTSLEGVSETVAGDFLCGNCDSLKILKGAPKYLSGSFDCSGCNKLESIEGVPDKINGDFDCSNCKSLKSLKGLPSSIGGSLYLPKIDSLFDEIGAKIISQTSVKGEQCVVPIYR